MKKTDPLERDWQPEVIEYAKSRRWFVTKIEFKSMRGGPDLLCIRDGTHLFIENKKRGEQARLQQALRIAEMQKQGAWVVVCDDLVDAKIVLR